MVKGIAMHAVTKGDRNLLLLRKDKDGWMGNDSLGTNRRSNCASLPLIHHFISTSQI